MQRHIRLIFLGSVILATLAVVLVGADLLHPQPTPIIASNAPRSFHTLQEFKEWRAQYPAHLQVNGDCDVLAEYLSRLAAENGFLLGYTYVPYTGTIDGIRVFPINSWTSHVANLIMTDHSLYYYDDNSKQIIYIGARN